MGFLRKILDSGISYASSESEERNISLCNYISVVISLACILTIVARLFTRGPSLDTSLGLIAVCSLIFLLPLALNRLGFIKLSRFYLSWVPSLAVLAVNILALKFGGKVELSDFIGIRILLLAVGSIPFLLFEVRKPFTLAVALAGSAFPFLFYDAILNLFDVGHSQLGISDTSFKVNQIRFLVAFFILSLSFYYLKRLIEKKEDLNETLLRELKLKNALVQEQAENKLQQLNNELTLKIEQLSEREFILNKSQRIARIGSWEYRIERNFLFWSDEMYEIFGLDMGFDLKAGNLAEALGSESKQLTTAVLHLLRTGESFDITIRTKTPIGYFKWFRICAFPIIEGTNAIGVRGICHDITFFKEAEEKLRAGEAKFAKVFENYPDFIMVVREVDLLVIDVNQRITDVLGFQKEEVLGRSAREMDLFLTEEERQRYIDAYALEGYVDYECAWKRKDGRIIQVKITGIRMDIGNQYFRMSVVQDVTERKAAEEKFLKAFDLSPDLMLILRERDFVVVDANRKIFEISGFTRDEVIGTSAEQEVFELWATKKRREVFYRKYKMKGSVVMEAKLQRKNGEKFFATISARRISLSDENHMIAVIRDITERKQAELEKEFARYQLKERIKELTALYRTSQALYDEHKSLHEILWEIVNILPSGWQYPEITVVRIAVGREVFASPNFKAARQKQQAVFQIQSNEVGTLEVGYTEDMPDEAEGPFVVEERNLINMVAEMLEETLARRYEQESLTRAQANLKATINNTEVLIWSVDRQHRLITFNTPFLEYIKKFYGVEPKVGGPVFVSLHTKEAREFDSHWEKIYNRSLSGEIVTLEESHFGFDFQYSLSPIIEESIVTGVSIFADNITERKNQDRQLAEANKNIGELKLMALRSVMSPHFIFNVLNSIQFFIAKNDRLNAITYLSTFSKLIRSILTHSINNKIRLADELDMLKNYVQLEMVRFEDKFSFSLNVDPEVDIESIEIPSLLIQPFVENAILHGLYNKSGNGILKIDVFEVNDSIVFQIEDDGIGREAAKKLREQNFPTHKSVGIKVTEERLQLINQKHNVVLEIDDLKNENGPCGTRVRIGVIYE